MANEMLRSELEIEASKALQQIKSFFRDAESIAQESGQSSGKALADGITKGINQATAALKKLEAEKIKLDFDQREGIAKLEFFKSRLLELSTKPQTSKVLLDTEKAKIQIDKLTQEIEGRKLRAAQVDVDISSAKNKITELSNQIPKDINSGAQSIKVGDIIKANLLSSGIQQVAQNLFNSISGTISNAFTKSQELTQLGLKYEVLLGSQEKAAQRQREILKYASETPFETAEISQADVVLQGFGIRTEKLLKNLGNASAVSGKDFSQLALIIGQISQSKNIGNLNQLYSAGILGKQDLVNAGVKFNLKTGEVESSIEELYEKVNQVIETKFKGGTDKLQFTIKGQLSTINDNITNAFDNIFKESGVEKAFIDFGIFINDTFKKIDFKAIGQSLGQTLSSLKSIISSIDTSVLQAGLAGLAGALLYLLIPAITGAIVALGGFLVSMLPVLAIGALVAGVAYLITSNWNTIGPIFEATKTTIINFTTESLQKLNEFKNNAIKSFEEFKKAFDTGLVSTNATTNILKSIGISDDLSSQISQKLLTIASLVKPSFEEFKKALFGNTTNNTSTVGIAKALGLDEESSIKISAFLLSLTSQIIPTFNQIKNLIADSGATIKQNLEQIFNNPMVQLALSQITDNINSNLIPALKGLWQTISTLVIPVFNQIMTTLGAVLPPILQGLAIIISTVLYMAIQLAIQIFSAFVVAINIAINVITFIGSIVTTIFSTMVSIIEYSLKTIVAFLTGDFASMQGITNDFMEKIKSIWQAGWNTVSAVVSNVWNQIVSTITTKVEQVKSAISGVVKSVQDAWNAVANFGSGAGSIGVGGGKALARAMSIGRNYKGTDFWKGGLTTVAERGRELISLPNGQTLLANALTLMNLPKGARIFNNQDTERMLGSFSNGLPAMQSSFERNSISNSSVINNNQDMSITNNNYTQRNRFNFGTDLIFN